MKFYTRIPVRDLSGTPIMRGEGDDKKRVPLGEFMAAGLVNAWDRAIALGRPDMISHDESGKRFMLAIEITRAIEKGDGWIELKSDQQEMIKKCAAVVHSTIVVGQIVKALDEKEIWSAEEIVEDKAAPAGEA